MKGKSVEVRKVPGMQVKGQPTRKPRTKKKPKSLAEHTRGLKAAIKY